MATWRLFLLFSLFSKMAIFFTIFPLSVAFDKIGEGVIGRLIQALGRHEHELNTILM